MGIRERGVAASDDFMRYVMGVLAAAKKTPMNAREAAATPPLLRPQPVSPNALPLRDPVTGQMIAVPRQYSPGQVAGSRAAIVAPVVAGGYGANALLDDAPVSRPPPSSLGSDIMFDRPGLPDDALGGFAPSYGNDLMPDRPGLPDDTLGGTPIPAAPRRPSAPQSAPQSAAAAADPSLMSRLFSGPDYQSNNQAVVSRPQGPMSDGSPQRTTLNWGDSGSAADFFRADKAMQELRRNNEDFVGMASGGAANGSSNKSSGSGRDAAIHKALEIIHSLLMQRR